MWRASIFTRLVSAILFVGGVLDGAGADIEWVKFINPPGDGPPSGYITGRGVAVDSSGNSYVAINNNNGPFLIKFDSGGNLVWSLGPAVSGGYAEYETAVAVSNDEIYFMATLSSNGSGSLGPLSWSSNGFSGMVVGQVGRDKQIRWVKSFNFQASSAINLRVDSSGGIDFAMMFNGSIQIDSHPFNTIDNALPTAVVKLSGTGAFEWGTMGFGLLDFLNGAPYVYNTPGSLGITLDGGLLVAGNFTGNTFGLGGVVVQGELQPLQKSLYLVKLDGTGAGRWGKSIGSLQDTNDVVGHFSSGTCSARGGDVIWTGDFVGQQTVDGLEIAAIDQEDVFVARLDANGQIKWVKSFGGLGNQYGADCVVDAQDNIYVAGFFQRALRVGSYSFDSYGVRDIFVVKLTPTGEVLWAKQFGYTGDETAVRMAVTPSNDLIVAGAVEGGGRFDNIFLSSTHHTEAFILKIKSDATTAPTISAQPAPVTFEGNGQAQFSVGVSNGGGSVRYQWFFNGQPIAGATGATYTIADVSAANEGSYYVQVTNDAGTVQSTSAQLVYKVPLSVLVTTVAGNGSPGYVDSSNGAEARFYKPTQMALFANGTLLVADCWNHLIRLVDPSGAVTTYAGQTNSGFVNGPGASARFKFPISLAVDKEFNVLVADYENNVIRKIDSFGLRNVSTVAGSGVQGYRDGASTEAQFHFPNGLVVDTNGNIFVSEFMNHTVRKIAPDGTVTTVAGDGTPGYRDGVGTAAQFNQPGGLAIDGAGNLYVPEYTGQRIRKITPDGVVSTIAGTNAPGFVNGRGSEARFNTPDGMAVDPSGNLYVSEGGNHAIRKIDPLGNVTTIAGLGIPGFRDGDETKAMFYVSGGIVWHPSGSLYVADILNHAIRRVDFLLGPAATGVAELAVSLNPMLTIYGQKGKTYRIEAAESGTLPLNWTALDTITLSNDTELWADSQPATRGKRYYRAVRVD